MIACSEVVKLTHRGLHSARSLTHRHVIAPAPRHPCQILPLRHCLKASAGVATSCLALCSTNNARGLDTHQRPTLTLASINNVHDPHSAETSCTPLTTATLPFSRKPTHASTPRLQPSKHPKAHATAHATGLVRITPNTRNDAIVRSAASIISVHRSDSGGRRSMSAEHNKQHACFLLLKSEIVAQPHFHSGKASGFCRCTLSACVFRQKCLSKLLLLRWWRDGNQRLVSERECLFTHGEKSTYPAKAGTGMPGRVRELVRRSRGIRWMLRLV